MTSKPKAENLKDIEDGLRNISAEEKRTALYQFVFGLLRKAQGNTMGASACFDKAMTYDPDFLDARRESVLLGSQTGPLTGKDLLNADLGELVGSLFKKKK